MVRSPHRIILLMVHELHRTGYQRPRIRPGMAPSGLHWRCAIAAPGAQAVNYTTGQARAYFGWDDAAGDTPEQLAQKFAARFAELCAQGRGADQAYADWFAELLRLTEPDGAPLVYADWELDPNAVTIMGDSQHRSVPLPPTGNDRSI